MLAFSSPEYPVEKYSEYRNRTLEKFYNRTKNAVGGVMQSSLKPKDKIKMLEEMISIVKSNLP